MELPAAHIKLIVHLLSPTAVVLLRTLHDICIITLFYLDFQLLIPFVEEDASKREDRSAAPSRPNEERREIAEVNKVTCPGIETLQHSQVHRFRSQLGGPGAEPLIEDDKHHVLPEHP